MKSSGKHCPSRCWADQKGIGFETFMVLRIAVTGVRLGSQFQLTDLFRIFP